MASTRQSSAYVQTASTPDVIDLRLGQPSPSLLPLDEVREAAMVQLRGDPTLLQYGRREGHVGIREQLGHLLAERYGQSVSPDGLVVTGGTSSALALCCQVFAPGGGVVVCEDPTYFLATGIFASHGLTVEGVPTDAHGLRVEVLAHRLEAGLRPRFVYCIPSFQNPTGVCLAGERIAQLVELAERYDFVIVADEPYNLLSFAGPAPRSAGAWDDGRGRVLSLGSFSKILGPGLRLGWLQAAPSLRARFLEHGSLRSGGGLNPVIARIVEGTLESGFLGRHIDYLRQTLGERARVLYAALREHGYDAEAPTGGYFVWCDLGTDTTARLEEARRDHGVGYCPGSRCSVGGQHQSHARLSFSFYEPDELREAAARLALVFHS